MSQETIELLVEGGNAKPGPASITKLSVFKLNIGELFQKINEKTKDYEDMNVPVKILIDKKTNDYSIKIGSPPVSSLIKKELRLKKIAPEKKEEEEKEEVSEKEENEKTETEDIKKAKLKKKTKKEEKEKVIVGNLTIDQCIKITKMKIDDLLAKDMKKALKEVVASVVSMPLTIEGKTPKEVLKEIDQGKYDDKF